MRTVKLSSSFVATTARFSLAPLTANFVTLAATPKSLLSTVPFPPPIRCWTQHTTALVATTDCLRQKLLATRSLMEALGFCTVDLTAIITATKASKRTNRFIHNKYSCKRIAITKFDSIHTTMVMMKNIKGPKE